MKRSFNALMLLPFLPSKILPQMLSHPYTVVPNPSILYIIYSYFYSTSVLEEHSFLTVANYFQSQYIYIVKEAKRTY